MRYEGYESDTDVEANGRRLRRGREISRSLTCVSPWFIFCRWFSGGKSRVSRKKIHERNGGKAKIDRDGDVERKIETVSSASTEEFSEVGKEALFNNGMGFGLIYLVRDELNKMVELRKRIETLLQNFQTEIENRDDKQLCIFSRSSISSSLAKACVEDILLAAEHDSRQFLSPDDAEQPEIGYRCEGFKREKSLRMDQLEAELAAEFDLLQMDGEFLYPEVNVEHNAAELGLNMCHEFSNSEFCGVSPRDLERKLHEVLESRQQERISELESALECAMQQLEAKQRELSWWEDAASLVAPAFSTFLFQVKQESEVGQTARSLISNFIYNKNNVPTI